MIATAASERILRDFKPSNIEYPLAIRLAGKFKTAFPNGPPGSGGVRPSSGAATIETQGEHNDASASNPSGPAAPEDGRTPLKNSLRRGEVILVGDTDLLNDKVCVRVQNVMGRPVINAVNGNLYFVQTLVEQFVGNEDLITSRNRGSVSRPFTRLKELETKAGQQWQEKILLLETRQRETEQKIRELQTAHPTGGGNQNLILSPAQEKALEDYRQGLVRVGKELKQLRKNLRRDTEQLEFQTKVVNIGGMPMVVAISGLGLAVIKTKRRSIK
jgi:ABC-type uncharacterized transport system involved in gliding motility auxiliary subunit